MEIFSEIILHKTAEFCLHFFGGGVIIAPERKKY